ncbi:hypothetical protein J7T88_03990 [Streptococcus thermophilus]|uniref:DpnII family type II restriction endonuclease n=1 Tax=Streptococcus thermophilus TaxID=1308 RepID=UPI0035571AA3
MKYNVFEYLNLNSNNKLEFFMETRSSLSFLASYWFNFKNVQKNLELYDSPDLYTLDYLIGKSDKEMDEFFRRRPEASATEFKDLHDRFSRTNHEFIYITDGSGWDSDKSHLIEAMEYIGKVFNYKMIEEGYLFDYLE